MTASTPKSFQVLRHVIKRNLGVSGRFQKSAKSATTRKLTMNDTSIVKKQLFSCNFKAVPQQSGEFFKMFYDSQQIYLPL